MSNDLYIDTTKQHQQMTLDSKEPDMIRRDVSDETRSERGSMLKKTPAAAVGRPS